MERQIEYKYKIGEEVNIGNFHAIIIGYGRDKSGNRTYKYKCLKCGYDGEKLAASIAKGLGCPCCANKIVVKGVNDIPTTAPWMIPYFQGGIEEASQYTKASHKWIYPKCPFCESAREEPMKINTIYNNNGIGCACKDNISTANKMIYDIMRQCKELNLITYFKREYQFLESKQFYDMYFKVFDHEYLVEMDSDIHSYIKRKHGIIAVPARSLLYDHKKDELAKEHGIPLIRIDCYKSEFDYIKSEIEKSMLAQIIDMKKIDWMRVMEFSFGNLIKNVCEYRKNNPDATTTIISKEFGLSVSTVMCYLKYGNRLNWCYYDSKEEWLRTHRDINSPRFISIETTNLTTKEIKKYKTLTDFMNDPTSPIKNDGQKKRISKLLKENNNFIQEYKGYSIKRINKGEK